MWRVQAVLHLVFEFLPGYQSFQVELKGAEVKGALIAQGGRELTFDVTGRGKRHGERKDGVIDRPGNRNSYLQNLVVSMTKWRL